MIKRIRTHLILMAAAAAAILAGIGCTSNSTGPPNETDTVTVFFRDGAEPLPSYLGTRDAVIRDGSTWIMKESNNGTAPIDTLGLADIGGSLYERRLLVRFDLTSITDCGNVASAMLTISFEPEDTNRTIWLDAWEATVPEASPGSWEEGLLGEGVSWLYVDHGDPAWATEGGDYLELMDSRSVKADTVVTFELAPARVEAWIKIPSRNHGVLIRPRTGGQEAFLHVYMREIAAVGLRPELLIKYVKGG
jgi:hypothetical protein